MGSCGKLWEGASARNRVKCNECTAAVAKEYYYNTIDRRTDRRFGLPLGSYAKMLEAQNGVCAICSAPPTEGYQGRLAVDHDHSCCPGRRACGKCVRGLLCKSCNLMLGYAKDDVVTLRAGIAYLENSD